MAKKNKTAHKESKPKAPKETPFHQPFAVLKERKIEGAAVAVEARPPPRPKAFVPQASLNEDEALSFHRMMSGVAPLDRKGIRIPKTVQSLEPSATREMAARIEQASTVAESEAASVHEHLRALVEGEARFELSDDGRQVEGRRLDVPPSVVRKLRRGVIPIDARLDLHGCTASEARIKLESFLKEKRARGERCVLIIHGKGSHSVGGQGVLRGEISAWLSQGRSSQFVAAFATSVQADGGEGALYVLLRS